MSKWIEENSVRTTEEGQAVVQMSKALFESDIDETFRVLGRFMDKRELKVSATVIDEFDLAGRIVRL